MSVTSTRVLLGAHDISRSESTQVTKRITKFISVYFLFDCFILNLEYNNVKIIF